MRHAIALFAFLFLFGLSATAQDQAQGNRLAVEQAGKDGDVNKELTVDKKFTGRLPNGYRDVVSSSQREEIYKIQREYFDVIELLKRRVELLESERNSKIDGLLTDEQRARIRAGSRAPGRSPRNTSARGSSYGGE